MVKRISSLDTNYIIKKKSTNDQIGINFKKINDLKLSQISFWPNTLEKVGSHLMKNLNITGYGDDLTINGIRIGDLSPQEHENIEKEKGGQNYKPLEHVVVSHVQD